MRNIIRALAVIVALGATVSCSNIDLAGPGGGVTGTYYLQAVNGFSPPFTIYEDASQRVDIVDETFTLFGDGTYEDEYQVRIASRLGVNFENQRDFGTWDLFGDSIEFRDSSTGQFFEGFVSGRTLTIYQGGNTFTFRR